VEASTEPAEPVCFGWVREQLTIALGYLCSAMSLTCPAFSIAHTWPQKLQRQYWAIDVVSVLYTPPVLSHRSHVIDGSTSDLSINRMRQYHRLTRGKRGTVCS
jgi:hypothetical protein